MNLFHNNVLNICGVFNAFNGGQVVATILLTVFVVTIWVIKTFFLNRKNVIDLLVSVVILLICIF